MVIATLLVGIFAFAFVFILATIAPLGSLGWWAGWFGEELSLDEIEQAHGNVLQAEALTTAFFSPEAQSHKANLRLTGASESAPSPSDARAEEQQERTVTVGHYDALLTIPHTLHCATSARASG